MPFKAVVIILVFLAVLSFFSWDGGLAVILLALAFFMHRYLDFYPTSFLSGPGRSSRFLRRTILKRLIGKKREIFLTCAFSMLAKLAKADGIVSKEEIRGIDRFIDDSLKLSPEQRKRVIQIFRQAKESPRDLLSYAVELFSAFSRQHEILVIMIDLLLDVAAADGQLSEEEELLISEAALFFGLSEEQYEYLRAHHLRRWRSVDEFSWSAYQLLKMRRVRRFFGWASGGEKYDDGWQRVRSRKRAKGPSFDEKVRSRSFSDPLDRYYAVLNCTRDASPARIKKNYRKLVLKHHPDRVLAQGLPEEFVAPATKRFREIQEAYEKICEKRGIK